MGPPGANPLTCAVNSYSNETHKPLSDVPKERCKEISLSIAKALIDHGADPFGVSLPPAENDMRTLLEQSRLDRSRYQQTATEELKLREQLLSAIQEVLHRAAAPFQPPIASFRLLQTAARDVAVTNDPSLPARERDEAASHLNIIRDAIRAGQAEQAAIERQADLLRQLDGLSDPLAMVPKKLIDNALVQKLVDASKELNNVSEELLRRCSRDSAELPVLRRATLDLTCGWLASKPRQLRGLEDMPARFTKEFLSFAC